LYDLSTPTSPNYGKWLSKDEIVNNYLAVHQDHIDAVQKFLVEHGVKNIRISDLKDKILLKCQLRWQKRFST
jgi:tripeptidyl-peptidase-1